MFKNTGLAILVFLISLSSAQAAPEARSPFEGSDSLGKYWVTFYYVVNEKSYPNIQDATIKGVDGEVLAKVNSLFKKDLAIEGTGWLRNGHTVNYAAYVNKETLYRYSSSKYGWGVGRCPLVPYRVIAVDPAKIPLGSVVFIPETKGAKLPDGTIHDGMFRAVDIGSAIKENHIDIFAEVGKVSSYPFERVGVRTKTYVNVYRMADANSRGCHTKTPEK